MYWALARRSVMAAGLAFPRGAVLRNLPHRQPGWDAAVCLRGYGVGGWVYTMEEMDRRGFATAVGETVELAASALGGRILHPHFSV